MERVTAGVLCGLATGAKTPEALASALGVDRRSVDEAVSVLAGRALARHTDDGRLALDPSLAYDAAGLRRVLPPPYRLTYAERVGSTNAVAASMRPPAPPGRALVIAREQDAGRGRHDRRWSSPPGGIWASVLEGGDRPAEAAWEDQLAMSVAVTDVTAMLGLDTRLKWPNDVVTEDGEKLAGVLLEATSAGGRVTRSVCGVGVNADVDPAALPPGATSLAARLGRVAPIALVAHLLTSYEARRGDPPGTLARWRLRSDTLGRRVAIECPDGVVSGTALAIEDAGGLVVGTGAGRETVTPDRCRRLRYRPDPG